MFFSLAFSVNKNVIKVNDNEDVEFFYQNFVNIAVKSD